MDLETLKKPLRGVLHNSRRILHKLRIPIRIHGVWILSHELRSETILRKIFNRLYEIDEISEILPRLQEDDVVLELGAAIGVVTCAMAKKVRKGKVLAFEPNFVIAELCERHLRLNSVDNVELRRSVLGLVEGTTKFYVAPDYWSSSLTKSADLNEIECKVERLESTLSYLRPSVVVMDIEGGEYELLNSDHFLQCNSIKQIFIEFHPVREIELQLEQIEGRLKGFSSSVPFKAMLHMLQEGKQPTVVFTRL